METDKIPSIVLILISVALLIGIGVLLFDKFSDATKTTASVADETFAIASGIGTTANNEIVTSANVGVGNTSIGCFLLNNPACGNVTNAELGTIKMNASFADGSYKINYSYLADSKASEASDSAGTSLGDIADTWMTVIITIIVMSLIIGMVVYSFQNKRD